MDRGRGERRFDMRKKIIFAVIMAVILISSVLLGSVRQNALSSKMDKPNTSITPKEKTIAVVVKTNELDLVDFKSNNNIISLDSGGVFFHPIISPDKSFIAYQKDSILYETTQNGEKTKVQAEAPLLSYIWLDNNHLLYSMKSRGIYIYDSETRKSEPYVKNKFSYNNITIGDNKKIYAEKYRYYNKVGKKYVRDYGVVLFPPDSRKEQLIISSEPEDNQQNSLGMYPVIAGISKDTRILYIFEHPHAGSLAADGMSLGSYDTQTGKYFKCPIQQVVTLGYIDNFSSDPETSEYIALINGGGREMNYGKTLGILNVQTGTFESLLPQGQAAMTPYYSADGKNILYASSKEIRYIQNIGEWIKAKHPIYKINVDTKQITQLTNSPNVFDFAPVYINNNDIVFLRMDISGNVSIWRLGNGDETKIIDGLVFYSDQYKIQNYYGHFNNSYYTDFG